MKIRCYFLIIMVSGLLSFSGKVCAEEKTANDQEQVVIPTESIELFNGENLEGFYTWLADYKFEDPDKVFTVVDRIDGAPAIRISGEYWGGIITDKSYSNYHLVAEFRWGLITHGRRKDRALDSGILLHAQRPEGNINTDFNGPWLRSVEYQIIEGGTGDMILISGYTEDGEQIITRIKTTVKQDYSEQYLWDPEGLLRSYKGIRGDRRINWYGRDPEWENVIGFRGFQDVEKPVGEWNRVEVIADGNTLTYLLNGKIVNKGFDSNLTEGRLLFQSEGAEIFFRRIELHPIIR